MVVLLLVAVSQAQGSLFIIVASPPSRFLPSHRGLQFATVHLLVHATVLSTIKRRSALYKETEKLPAL